MHASSTNKCQSVKLPTQHKRRFCHFFLIISQGSWEKGWLVTDGKLPCFSSTRTTIFWCSSFFPDRLATAQLFLNQITVLRELSSQLAPYEIQIVKSSPDVLARGQIAVLRITIAFCNCLSAPREPLSMAFNTGKE